MDVLPVVNIAEIGNAPIKDGDGDMVEPKNELERVAQTIASCMPCHCCPDQYKARENSSMANCVHHWMETMRKVVSENTDELR